MLHEASLTRSFARRGARFRLTVFPAFRGSSWVIDLIRVEKRQVFELRVAEPAVGDLQAVVAHLDRDDRHLLLLVRQGDEASVHRYLCGHDEREWFIATVPKHAATVAEAKEALKPPQVKAAFFHSGLRRKERNRRRNRAFLRQGEWFFVPAPDLAVDPHSIHRQEPLQRGSGHPHIAEEVYREGGTLVYVYLRQVLTPEEYRQLLKRDPRVARQSWQSRLLNPRVYARGTVRHRDHAALVLRGWHRVLPNTEAQASGESLRRLAFID